MCHFQRNLHHLLCFPAFSVRAPTPPEERLARERERELRALERAARTVFVTNVNLRADERDLFQFFSKVGKVMDIKIIMDKHTKKSKVCVSERKGKGKGQCSALWRFRL